MVKAFDILAEVKTHTVISGGSVFPYRSAPVAR